MFMGVTAHHNAIRVRSFSDAERCLAKLSKTATGKARKPKDLGFSMGGSKGQSWVRQDDDGSIAFRLYNTDVVVWHPDGSFTVENFGSVTTSGFASRFTPDGIHLQHARTIMGETRGHNTIQYRSELPGVDAPRAAVWSVCTGDIVRFVETDGHWLPDEETLDTIRLPARGSVAKSREISARYHLKDFAAWLVMAPRHLELVRVSWDLDICAEALERRDFKRAAEHMPALKTDNLGFGLADKIKPLRIRCPRGKAVTMACVDKLRLALLEHEDLLETVEVKTITGAAYDKHMALLRQMEALNLNTRGLGPNA